MDARKELIDKVMLAMQSELETDQLRKLNATLYIQMNDYDVQVRCTDLALADNSPDTALKRFIASKRLEGKSEKTLRLYSFYLTEMLHNLGKTVDEITVYDIRFYLASYQEKHQISNRTVENMRNCFRSFFSWLTSEGLIPSDPTISIKPVKYQKKELKAFSAVEMEQLRTACVKKRDRALIEFLYASGCRISEALALDRNDIDFTQKSAVVTGKGNKQRTIYLTDTALLYLSDYLDSRTDGFPCLFYSTGSRSNDEHRLTKSGAEQSIRKIGDRAGVRDAHPHRFRRTLATDLIGRGASIQDVSTILGHESLETTKIYCQISQEDVNYTYRRCIA